MSDSDNLEYDDGTNYEKSAPITVQDALNKDKDDDSLTRWKAELLSADVPRNVKNIIFDSIIVKEQTGAEVITIEQASELLESKGPLFVVPEKSTFEIGFVYRVFNKIISGLHAVFKVSKLGISLAKQSVMLGSYAPREEEYEYFMEEIDVPGGPMGRGLYAVKCVFGDDDSKTGSHGKIEFWFRVGKDATSE